MERCQMSGVCERDVPAASASKMKFALKTPESFLLAPPKRDKSRAPRAERRASLCANSINTRCLLTRFQSHPRGRRLILIDSISCGVKLANIISNKSEEYNSY